MQEDIKILKYLLEHAESTLLDNEADAISHILNRLEQDKRVIEEMAECIHRTQHCKVLFGGKQVVPYYTNEIIDHFRKRCE